MNSSWPWGISSRARLGLGSLDFGSFTPLWRTPVTTLGATYDASTSESFFASGFSSVSAPHVSTLTMTVSQLILMFQGSRHGSSFSVYRHAFAPTLSGHSSTLGHLWIPNSGASFHMTPDAFILIMRTFIVVATDNYCKWFTFIYYKSGFPKFCFRCLWSFF